MPRNPSAGASEEGVDPIPVITVIGATPTSLQVIGQVPPEDFGWDDTPIAGETSGEMGDEDANNQKGKTSMNVKGSGVDEGVQEADGPEGMDVAGDPASPASSFVAGPPIASLLPPT